MKDGYFTIQYRWKCRVCGKIFDNLGTHEVLNEKQFPDGQLLSLTD